MNDPTVELQGITKRFGRMAALGGITLSMSEGITGLLGPNGAGKTTLLRCLATVETPDDGTLQILHRNPEQPTERTQIRRRLGYMPQEPGFYPNFTAYDFLDYLAVLKEVVDDRQRRREVRRVLEAVDLTDRAMTKIRKLSGGMRRRLALAQALLADPQLLILDEPTSGLDPGQRLRFRDLVSHLAEDRTVLLSTHQTEDVAALCERVIVMDQGQVLFDGSPSGLSEVARGRVWLAGQRSTAVRLAWRNADGQYRTVGDAPAGADLAEPTIDDGYLLLVGDAALGEVG
ncbi:ABC transporter ATP-binding protein [soil metagenome]